VQDALLQAGDTRRLSVYAVWFNMFPGDARTRWRKELLPDARVAHYWDEGRAIGSLYFRSLPQIWEKRAAETLPPDELVLWDAYLLYAPDARWTDEPPDVVSWGATILLTKDRLLRDLTGLLAR
jgi:hypothetical protein